MEWKHPSPVIYAIVVAHALRITVSERDRKYPPTSLLRAPIFASPGSFIFCRSAFAPAPAPRRRVNNRMTRHERIVIHRVNHLTNYASCDTLVHMYVIGQKVLSLSLSSGEEKILFLA